jgi:predicted ribosomally synthesized peptide with SipW-like signal peptide
MKLGARRTMLAFLVLLACGGVGATFAAFTDTTSTSGSSFNSATTFLEHVKEIGSAGCGTTSDTVTVPAGGVPAGNTLIVRVGYQDRGGMGFAASVSDSKGNSYQLTVNHINSQIRASIYRAYITAPLAAGDTITLTHPDIDSTAIGVTEFRGVDAGAPDQTAANGGGGTNPSASVTTTNANDLVVGVVVHDEFNSSTNPGGWAVLPTITQDCGVPPPHTLLTLLGGYRIESSTGTFTYDPTLGTFRTWADLVAAYFG